MLSGVLRTKTVSRVQPPFNHPCLQDVIDARAGMGTTIPVPDLCKIVARGGWGQRLLSKPKLAGMPEMVFVLYPASCIFLMHRAGITPSVPGVSMSLVITFQQIWLMPMPAV